MSECKCYVFSWNKQHGEFSRPGWLNSRGTSRRTARHCGNVLRRFGNCVLTLQIVTDAITRMSAGQFHQAARVDPFYLDKTWQRLARTWWAFVKSCRVEMGSPQPHSWPVVLCLLCLQGAMQVWGLFKTHSRIHWGQNLDVGSWSLKTVPALK